ncbi:MFS transporter [Hephaestia sp. GCM10023244]|uniref:MFS transporter n=1 Tax=unclassified Hephaestia TaxID=2631281 RepID=UPI002076E635|nr:MFS transporter [Hephaestia sp. MAHUQ-44]MCM8732047.1 MFS transporter [Hephaestia sp. MAHUQ-44]
MADTRHAGVRKAVEAGPLRRWQIITLVLCVLINISDGLDTSSVAYAAPSILREWGVGARAMGLVFSVGAAGLVCGALFIAPQADRVGRRTIILGAVAANSLSMLATAFIHSVELLLLLRFVTGLGIGALVPSLSVMVVEFSTERRGNIFLALVHVGFAIGAMLGAAVGALLIGPFGWQAIFIFAGLVSLVLTIVAFWLLPESLNFLLTRQPRNALARANILLARLGEPPLDALPPREAEGKRRAGLLHTILAPRYRTLTLLLWLAAFSRYFVSYFLTQWKPQILVLAGVTPELAIASGIVTGGAAILGALLMGTVAATVGARRATCASFMLCAASLVLFGVVEAEPVLLLAVAGLALFAIEATFTGVVITSTRFYPPEFRTTGVGFTIGVGRFGAIAGPYLGGALLAMGLDRSFVYPVYAAVCGVGAVAIMIGFTRRGAERHAPA